MIDEATANDAKKAAPDWIVERIAKELFDLTGVPSCREKSLALTKLDEAEMWAKEMDGYSEAVKKLREAIMWGQRARFAKDNAV